MDKLPNIFFVGKAGAGKTYLSNYLIEKYGYIHSKMANSVYMLAEKYLGMSPTKKDRKLLQYLGTDVGRNKIHPDIWVNRFLLDTLIVEETAKYLYNKDVKFVSDDVRFFNEFSALAGQGWVGIYLDVSDEIRIKRLEGRDGDACIDRLNHESETALDVFKDQLIKVDVSGSLEQSYENLEQTLEYIRKEKK
jgi:dephospho-CoA kinase